MGYESRFYIVKKTDFDSDDKDNLRWADVVAMFDMSKVYCIKDKIMKYPKTDVYIYNDGDIKITEDAYGDPLIEIPLEDMLQILKEVKPVLKDYFLYKPFVNAIKGFVSECGDWRDIVVLHYGY